MHGILMPPRFHYLVASSLLRRSALPPTTGTFPLTTAFIAASHFLADAIIFCLALPLLDVHNDKKDIAPDDAISGQSQRYSKYYYIIYSRSPCAYERRHEGLRKTPAELLLGLFMPYSRYIGMCFITTLFLD